MFTSWGCSIASLALQGPDLAYLAPIQELLAIYNQSANRFANYLFGISVATEGEIPSGVYAALYLPRLLEI